MATLKQEYTRSDLNETKAKIDDKAAVVEQDKADIANLEDDLRKAGGDPGWATPAAQPDQSGPAAQPGTAPQPGAAAQGATPPANPPARPSAPIGY
jgi:hypothetical protein